MSGQTIGSIIGIVAGGAAILAGLTMGPGRTDPNVSVTNDEGQTAVLTGDSKKWVLIIVGIVLAVGGIIGLLSDKDRKGTAELQPPTELVRQA